VQYVYYHGLNVVCMWAIVQYVRRKDQQDAHFSLMI